LGWGQKRQTARGLTWREQREREMWRQWGSRAVAMQEVQQQQQREQKEREERRCKGWRRRERFVLTA
jgi:hypothetical protein